MGSSAGSSGWALQPWQSLSCGVTARSVQSGEMCGRFVPRLMTGINVWGWPAYAIVSKKGVLAKHSCSLCTYLFWLMKKRQKKLQHQTAQVLNNEKSKSNDFQLSIYICLYTSICKVGKCKLYVAQLNDRRWQNVAEIAFSCISKLSTSYVSFFFFWL